MLAALGIVFDTTTATSSIDREGSVKLRSQLEDMFQLANLFDHPFESPYYHTNGSTIVALWHTLNSGIESHMDGGTLKRYRLRSNDLSQIRKFLQSQAPTSSEAAEVPWNDYQTLFLSLINATWCRRIFTTKTGYICLGPEKCQKGDAVIILFGGDIPYIVRPAVPRQSKECFTFLGDAYVHGIMDGQALLPENGVPTRRLKKIVLV